MFNAYNNRIVLMVEGAPIRVRLCPHLTDDSLVMLKAPAAEFLQVFLKEIAVLPKGEITEGANYFMVAADRNQVVDAMPKLFNRILLAKEAKPVKQPVLSLV